jgi:flagellum-specific peptidoglycan hydrolase FlgJ
VEGGKSIYLTQPFRKFDSLTEAFDLHGQLLAHNPAYKPAMALKDNPEAFADALTGVYATDPQYGTTLKFVMRTYGFEQLDQ